MSDKSKDDFYFAYSASLRIMDMPDKHEEITDILGVKPSICHKADEVNKYGELWGNDIWTIKSPLPESQSLDEHIEWLSNLVSPHKNYVHGLMAQGADVDIFLGYRSDCEWCGFDLKAKSLALFTELGVDMTVSIIV